jgi:hypothetical protein
MTEESLAELRQLVQTRIKQKAQELVQGFGKSEHVGARFGLFPQKKMERAQMELLLEFNPPGDAPYIGPVDLPRLLAVAVMDALGGK